MATDHPAAAHAAFLTELNALARPVDGDLPPQNDSYGGSGRPFFNVSVPDRRKMVRRWLAGQKRAPVESVSAVVERLFDGASHEEKTLATLILRGHAKARAAASPDDIDRWLGKLNGWAEVDSLCQNVFTAAEMAADWPAWRGLIERLSRDGDINKRRAALVLLTGPTHYVDDTRFSDLAFGVIERLKAERPILITKAVSWLLRALADRHHAAVAAYLAANAASLPAIAVRETRTKLATGTKSGKTRR